MKLVEFLSPLAGSSQQDYVLACLFYIEAVEGKSPIPASEVRSALVESRVPRATTWNVSTVLTRAGAMVDSPRRDKGKGKLWWLTDTGRKRVTSRLDVGTIRSSPGEIHDKADVENIRSIANAIASKDVRDFANEAVSCLSIDANRAAVVFMWVAAAYHLQNSLWLAATPRDITDAARKQNPKAREVKKRDDLSEFNEALLLQLCQDFGVIDKNQKIELGKCLSLRNACGHPNRYRPGRSKTKAHIEDIILTLFA